MNYLDKTGLTRLWSKIITKLGQKQDTLISGTNIKTINGNSILGNGDLEIKRIESETIKNIVACTTAEYNTSSKSSDTIYLITD